MRANTDRWDVFFAAIDGGSILENGVIARPGLLIIMMDFFAEIREKFLMNASSTVY